MRLLIVSCLGASPSIAAGQALAERMDRYLTELHLGGQLTGSVGVSERGEVLLAKGYGFADAEHEVSNTPQTRFRIGSMTKQFTAMAILILQEQGKLKVSDTLGMHLSGIPRTWEGLTIHQLLTHTSGLMHSWKLPGFEATMMVPASLDDVLKRFYEQPLVFKPGEGFGDSGLGYFVL